MRFAPEVYIAYDGDRAGAQAILRGPGGAGTAKTCPSGYWISPVGLDPDEFIRQEGLEAFAGAASPFQP